VLPRVRVPTLILHRSDDTMFSFRLAQGIASAIANARLVPLSKGIMSYLADGEIDHVLGIINDFIDDGVAIPAPAAVDKRATPAAGTAIILFTDIADSTALTERLGDETFRNAARALDEKKRAAIRDVGGTAIDGKVLGDGVMGVFASAARAIDAARRCVELSADVELPLHIGIHAGDVIREDDGHGGANVYGGAVNIASRVCALCEPGEILVSQTVRDLARTSAGVTFEDRGEHTLKGIDDPVRVFAVGPA
jgi:class 3 adenylate cyclase